MGGALATNGLELVGDTYCYIGVCYSRVQKGGPTHQPERAILNELLQPKLSPMSSPEKFP